MKASRTRLERWYELDNAAKIYPAIHNSRWTSNFRMSVTLKEQIDPALLQKALDKAVGRFPNFHLRLRRGLFWYYLEQNRNRAVVQPDVANPCQRLGSRREGYQLFRVRYFGGRIAVEVSHILCDGTGLMIFLKTLAAEYLKLSHQGLEIPCREGILNCDEPSSPEEMEDAFKRYAAFRALKDRRESKAYHFTGTQIPAEELNIVTGQLSVSQLSAKAKEYKVSITEFLTAVLIYSYEECQKESSSRVELPVKVSVPVNMRKYYPSKTLRNFSLFVNPGIEPKYGEYSFEEIVEEVHHFIRTNVKEKYLNAIMCKNLSSESNLVLRLVPLFVKNISLSMAFRLFGESRFSTTFSNLGIVRVPKEMEPFVERFDFLLGRQRYNDNVATMVTFGDTADISFTRKIKETEIERRFFTFLVRQGLHVKLESNNR